MKKFYSVMVALICVCSSFLYAFADTSQELPPEADSSGYVRDYLLEGESWLCEEHAVLYDPAFPDNVCYRCWKDAQDAQELQSYSVSPYSLANSLDESGISTLAETSGGITIQDNLFQPYGVVYRSGNSSWTHCTFNETSGYQFTQPYITASSGVSYLKFGFQQLQSVTLSPESWVCFSLDIRDSTGNVVVTSGNFKQFSVSLGSEYVDKPVAASRTVLDMSDDGKYFYALRFASSQLTTGSFVSIRFATSSGFSLDKNWTYTINDIQLYSGGNADEPPVGWAGGTTGGGGDTPAPPSDIEIIGGYFNDLFMWLENIRDNLTNGFSGLALSIDNSVQQAKIAITNVIDSMKSAVVSGLSSVESAVSSGFQGLKDYLDNVFGTTVSGDVSNTAGGIVDSIGQQEQTEQEFYTGFDSSVEQFAPDSYAVPTDIGNSIVWLLGCFTGLFNGLGSYKAVFLFVPAVSISLAMIGRIAQVTPGAYRAASRAHVFSNSNEHVKKE